MNLVEEIRQSWSWLGLEPTEVIGENDFGNLMIKDAEGKYWRLCPEDCSCEIVALDRQALDALSTNQEFLHDWNMRPLVELARETCGPLPEGKKYCLKIPAILGGEYGGDNLAMAPLVDIIRLSGDLAKQTNGVPDGAKVRLVVAH